MTDLSPIPALGGSTARLTKIGALTLAENAGLGLASLALRRGGAQPVPMGLALPGPGLWHAGNGIAAFWTGPGQWMLEGADRAEEDFARAVKLAAPDCSVTEQTDGFVALEVVSSAGAAPIERLCEKLVNVDLGRFGPGSATRTGLHHMTVFVIRRAEDRLAILGMRSLAGSLWHAVEGAAQHLEGAAT
ncbi:sarcosine oxidase subunit gamma [Paenirhodobacter hankyongi]|uniref:Sarcosine oxidase subunit gamma n=1 Tax=Paenirhodobacter hankyongi TaxID=2294033 RepID=A0A421BJ11_9RHOB|nr:sarcosine oxidase subunit gamma [Sinirhodobacter hankyongi]RLL61073.1 sarcosine oxidase subunit gamma [Sinirhodobacter hankyongi]